MLSRKNHPQRLPEAPAPVNRCARQPLRLSQPHRMAARQIQDGNSVVLAFAGSDPVPGAGTSCKVT